MFDYETLRKNLVSGFSKYLGCPVVRSNQNEAPPPYPYVSYTITTLMSENKGTYGECEDGKARKPFTQTWSITALSGDNSESVNLSVEELCKVYSEEKLADAIHYAKDLKDRYTVLWLYNDLNF